MTRQNASRKKLSLTSKSSTVSITPICEEIHNVRDIQTESFPSSNTKVETMLDGRIVPKDVKKRLIFGEALKDQIETNLIRNGKVLDRNEKQVVRKILSGHLLKKYRMQKNINEVVPYKENAKFAGKKINLSQYERKKRTCLNDDTKQNIRKFFENDEISRMCPGKNDVIVRNKIRKQKRVLLHGLQKCFKLFTEKFGNLVSFTTFYKSKPFWVVQAQFKDRETCACVKHENFNFIVKKLYFEKILDSQDMDELVNDRFKITSDADKNDDNIQINQWKTNTVEKRVKNVVKNIKVTSKVLLEMSKLELTNMFLGYLPTFKAHVNLMKHQMHYLRSTIENLQVNELAVQIDFSENYIAKLSTEIQTMHFGANKRQISIHTGVAYFIQETTKQTMSFATVSDNIDHQAYAVWCHMKPVLNFLITEAKFQNINRIYMFSDGPTSQYRNKFNINLAAKFLGKSYPNAKVSWNFSAPGHGKGPMDGIGGTVKRMADRCILKGADITCAEEFVRAIQTEGTKIILFDIEQKEIEQGKEKLDHSVSQINKITLAYQITWNQKAKKFYTRSLSCKTCEFDEECSHFSLDTNGGDGINTDNSILFVVFLTILLSNFPLKLSLQILD